MDESGQKWTLTPPPPPPQRRSKRDPNKDPKFVPAVKPQSLETTPDSKMETAPEKEVVKEETHAEVEVVEGGGGGNIPFCPALRHFFERDIFWSGTKRDKPRHSFNKKF